MDLPEQIARTLAPSLGDNTADAVARHLCTKHGIGEGPLAPSQLQSLRDTLRRGLVAFVGQEQAQALTDACFEGVSTKP
jgi:hypothetical protein